MDMHSCLCISMNNALKALFIFFVIFFILKALFISFLIVGAALATVFLTRERVVLYLEKYEVGDSC